MSTQLELGQKSEYEDQYNPDRLFPIPRAPKRIELGIDPAHIPFNGFDLWNHYEVSWLNAKGKPIVATAEVIYDCHSPNIIESKSLKLYFNTLNNTCFNSITEVQAIIQHDLADKIQAEVKVNLKQLGVDEPLLMEQQFPGLCVDNLDISCTDYSVDPTFLTTTQEEIEEILYSDLLKSNCLVTNQPDWGSVRIEYKGPKINREGLLHYIISFRNHNEFHEQCIERIFIDLLNQCKPKMLTVYGRYTRRGGIDINPYRTTNDCPSSILNIRLPRQ